jgi:hypothetical protein
LSITRYSLFAHQRETPHLAARFALFHNARSPKMVAGRAKQMATPPHRVIQSA